VESFRDLIEDLLGSSVSAAIFSIILDAASLAALFVAAASALYLLRASTLFTSSERGFSYALFGVLAVIGSFYVGWLKPKWHLLIQWPPIETIRVSVLYGVRELATVRASLLLLAGGMAVGLTNQSLGAFIGLSQDLRFAWAFVGVAVGVAGGTALALWASAILAQSNFGGQHYWEQPVAYALAPLGLFWAVSNLHGFVWDPGHWTFLLPAVIGASLEVMTLGFVVGRSQRAAIARRAFSSGADSMEDLATGTRRLPHGVGAQLRASKEQAIGYLEAGDTRRARAILHAFPNDSPAARRERYIYEARMDLADGAFERVLRVAECAQTRVPRWVESKRMISYQAWALLETNQVADAVALLQGAIRQYDTGVEAAGIDYFYYYLSRIQFEAQGTDIASRQRGLGSLREAIRIRPDCARANERLALYLAMESDFIAAGIEFFGQSLRAERKKARSLREALYHVLYATRIYQAKIGIPDGVALEELTRLKPVTNSMLLGTLALILVKMRVFYHADRLLREAVSVDPSNAYLHYAIGLMTTETGNPRRAKRALQKALKLARPWEAYLTQRAEAVLDGLG